MEYWIIFLSIIIGALSIYYLFHNFNFFKRHDIIHLSPSVPILGALTPLIFRQVSVSDFLEKIYNAKPDAKYFGFYAMTQPIFMFRDAELIKDVLSKNFEAFPRRGGFVKFYEPILAKGLFSLHGQKWREMRSLLTSAFTSGKMRTMFPLMSEYAVDFANLLPIMAADKCNIDIYDSFTKYTNDIITMYSFGIKVNSMKNPTNKFYVCGKEASTFLGRQIVNFIFAITFPKLMRIFGMQLLSDRVTNFFEDVIKTAIATRDTQNITHPNMLQLMINARDNHERQLDIEDMSAQAFGFFFGGFEISAMLMSFAVHEIAVNFDIQMKLRHEIDSALQESNGEVTYETINKLRYLHAVIQETLRLRPPMLLLERVCSKAYELPPASPGEKPFTMKKGMIAWVPINAIHHDEKYYDDPKKFRPDRFLNDQTYHNSPYFIPFGIGPRMCIANKFVLLKAKLLLFHLLARCELKPCAKTISPMKFSKNCLSMMPEGGFWLNVQCRSGDGTTVSSEQRRC